MPQSHDEVLLPSLDLGSARGGARREATPLFCEVVRELGEADLPALRDPGVIGSPGQRIAKLSYSHHQLARILAQTGDQVAACLATGYSQAYVSTISNHDPAFQELLAYYAAERQAIFTDTLERMKTLGIDTLEKLQDRLHDGKAEWSNRELMEMAELLLVKPMRATAGGGLIGPSGPPSGVTVNVKFVSPTPASPVTAIEETEVIEIQEAS